MRSLKFIAGIVIGLSVCCMLVFTVGIVRRLTCYKHGEITVYSTAGAEIEHFQEARYEQINSNTVIVYSGDRKIRYINCTIEVSGGI